MDYWQAASHKAATLAILFTPPGAETVHVVVTTRSRNLRTYPGEAALPGGHAEHDESCWQTAYRESAEEIGFNPSMFPNLEQVTILPPYLSRSLLLVQACVVRIPDETHLEAIAPSWSPDEVANVFSVPLSRFLDKPEVINLVPLAGEEWYFYRYPIAGNETAVVGLTAHILLDVARFVFGIKPKFRVLSELGFECGARKMLTSSMGSAKKRPKEVL